MITRENAYVASSKMAVPKQSPRRLTALQSLAFKDYRVKFVYRSCTHPQPRPFPAVIGKYHKRRPARALV